MALTRKRALQANDVDVTEQIASTPPLKLQKKSAGTQASEEDGTPSTAQAPSSQPGAAQPSQSQAASQKPHQPSSPQITRPFSQPALQSNPAVRPGSQPPQPSSSQNTIVIDDDNEPIDLTQDNSEPEWELYGNLDNKIVGVRYYRGYASTGEVVLIRREPSNPYDGNAIRVDNVLGHQIGHLPRKVVERLAPLIDEGRITLEGMLTGEKGQFDCPVRLFIFGPSNGTARAQLEERLKAEKLLRATQLKATRVEADSRRKLTQLRGQSTYSGLADGKPSFEELTKGSTVVDFRGDGDAIKTLAMDESALEKMPMWPQPAKLEAQLLPYQLQGLAWMISKESPQAPAAGSEDVVQLWKRDHRNRFVNVASNFGTVDQPKLLSGGILADDMGLGKTLEMISLIISSSPGPTLIIAPVTVMSNWEQQIQRHVRQEHMLSVFIYHGTRKATAAQLKGYDVVVSSYGKLSAENKMAERQRILMAVDWRRVVLDEGHTIRNARTETAVSACKLKAKSRWVLSGTPIVNNIKDLHSLLLFLGITGGLEQSEIFNGVITRPLSVGDKGAEALLQSLMQDLCLRRKKDMKFVDLRLPPKTEYVHRINFRADEKTKYDALLSEAKGALEEYQAKSAAGQKGRFQGVLERLLRLRQTCNHWMLCKERIDNVLKLLQENEVVPLNAKNRAILQQALQLVIDSQEECPVCFDNLTSPVITHCKHVFCHGCISKVITLQGKCPMCRNKLDDQSLVEPAPDAGGDETGVEFDADAKSSKTEALVKILQATLRDPKSKVVVFSQWVSFLDMIQAQVTEAGFGFSRIDGSMRADWRDAAIHALDTDPNTRIMLASLGVCSVGLNLVSADTVILADSWWAPAIEDQAVDRVHRLGQTRPTTVWRLIMEGTVEERVLDIQAEKRLLVGKAFQEKSKRNKSKETRMADLAKLLG